jgi:ABC-type transport system involved in multi-copper enzyme maturation permease subunit
VKALEILRFEMGYQARRWWTWLYVVVILGLSFLITMEAATGDARGGGYWANSPYAIIELTLIGTVMGLLVAAAFSGDAGARDPETRIAPLVYASPVAERTYLGARFGAAFLLNALVLLTVQVGQIAAILITDIPPELIGPMKIATYVASFIVVALPNAFLATALLFLLSVLSRRSVSSYLGAVVLFFTSIFVWVIVAEKLGLWELAKIIDPLGTTVFREISLTTTDAQKNALSIWSNSSLLLNRAVWLTVSAIIIAITHLRFRFETASSRAWWRRKTDSTDVTLRERSAPITIPKVEPSSGIAVRLDQFAVITMQSFREVAISWGGLVLLLLATITAVFGPKAMAHLGVPSVPTTEQMVNWVAHTGEIIWFIVPILTTFYAGELVWRDRETRMSEIADAAPVPEWVQLMGRYAGLALMLAVYQLLLIVACIVVQMQMGYYDFDLPLYARTVLGLSLTQHLLFAAVAFALHVIINQKYAGYLAVIGAYVFTQLAPSIGIEHHLLVYGTSPEWTYSDIKGFGPSLIPWMWFKTYWAAWAVFLLVVAILFWVRGREPGFKARLGLVRERLTPRAIGIVAAMFAVIIATGGFIFYNTNVLNTRESDDARLAKWARYEKTYGKFSGIAQPELSAISLRVDIHARDRDETVHAKYTLVNRSGSPIATIHLLPDDEVETSAAVFDRPARAIVDDKELYYRIYQLGTPLAPGDSLHVSFDVRFRPRGFTNDGIEESVVANGSYFEGNDWLPVIGYEREREVASGSDRKKHGLPPRHDVPSLDDTAALYTAGAKRIAFDAVISTDEGQTAVAPGELRRTWTENGRRYFQYVADAPIRNDFAIFSAQYSVRHEMWNNVAIEIVYHPSHAANVDRMMQSARASLDYFTKTFGPYPYRELRLVEMPGQSTSLHASPINITYQEAFAGLDPDADPRKFDLVYAVVAHETAHQWWGNQLSPADIEGGPLLTESLAWYSALGVVERNLGEDHLRRLLDMMHESSWTISTRADVPLLRIFSRYAAYRKGPFAMYALREYVGEDSVTAALRRLFDKYKSGEPPLPTSKDLYAELKSITPDSLQSLLSDLFERNTYWDLETKKVSATPAGPGQWSVTLDVVARKVVIDMKGLEAEMPMDDLVEIGVYGSGGQATRGTQLYRRFHRIKAGAQQITVLVSAKPVRAGIDPRYLLIDAKPGDNIKEVTTIE